MLCEMCGKDVETTNRVLVEGSVLSLCTDCSRFGTVLTTPATALTAVRSGPVSAPTVVERLARRSRRMEERDLFQELPDLELATDWHAKIRVAREKLGWTPEELAKRLSEKKSVVLKMESGSFHPPDTLVPKIEHLLKIRLRATPEPVE
jgi:putative transcription factor